MSFGSDVNAIPEIHLVKWKEQVISAHTGPNSGLTNLDLHSETFPEGISVAGVSNWNNPSQFAYGYSVSLYEQDKTQNATVGGVITDVFCIVVRENNAIIAVADGVNWGKKPRLAARCAVNSSVTYLSDNISKLNSKPTSKTLAMLLNDSIDVAHHSIIKHNATLTTLSIAVVCELKSSPYEWGLFSACVGDSPIYVYSPHLKQTYEATVGCHPRDGIRNQHFSGGALGPAIGSQPDLENYTLTYMPVNTGDIVLLMSDGVLDNFSPDVISKTSNNTALEGDHTTTDISLDKIVETALDENITCDKNAALEENTVNSESTLSNNPIGICTETLDIDKLVISTSEATSQNIISTGELPVQHKFKPCCENVKEISKFLQVHQDLLFDNISAQTVTTALLNFVADVTEEKRKFLEGCTEKGIDISKDNLSKSFRSKLDFATVVAYTVGRHTKS